MREYIRAIKILFDKGNYEGTLMLIWSGMRFVLRYARYNLIPKRCPTCGSAMELFFMRSKSNILKGEEDYFDINLCDWLICQNEGCMEALQLT